MENLQPQQQLTAFENRVNLRFQEFDQLKTAYDATVPALNTYIRNSLKNELATERINYVTQQRAAIETGLI